MGEAKLFESETVYFKVSRPRWVGSGWYFKTLFAAYIETDAVRNVVEDLINHGIERDKIYADEDKHEVMVMIPSVMEDATLKILNRHHPA